MRKNIQSARTSLSPQASSVLPTAPLTSAKKTIETPSTNLPIHVRLKSSQLSASRRLIPFQKEVPKAPVTPKASFYLHEGTVTDRFTVSTPKESINKYNKFFVDSIASNDQSTEKNKMRRNNFKSLSIATPRLASIALASEQSENADKVKMNEEAQNNKREVDFEEKTRSNTASQTSRSASKKFFKLNLPNEEFEEKGLSKTGRVVWRHNDISAFLALSTPVAPQSTRSSGRKCVWNINPQNKQEGQVSSSGRSTVQSQLQASPLQMKLENNGNYDMFVNSGNALTNPDSPKAIFTSLNYLGSPKEGYRSMYRSGYLSTKETGADIKSLKSWSNLDSVIVKQKNELATPYYGSAVQSPVVSPARSSKKSPSVYSFASEDNKDALFHKMNLYQVQNLELEFEDRISKLDSITYVQKDVYKDAPGGVTRMQMLPNEVQGVHNRIGKLQIQMYGKKMANKNTKAQKPIEVYEEMFKSDNRRLNALDIKAVQQEYAKKSIDEGSCDYARLDKIVNELKFFSTLEKIARVQLLRSASYKSYNAGDTIFSQGDEGDLMYIILRGAVNVKVTRANRYKQLETVSLGILYDGSYFGEDVVLCEKKDEGSGPSNIYALEATDLRIDAESHLSVSRSVSLHKKSIDSKLEDGIDTSPKELPVSQVKTFVERRASTVEVSESCDLLCIPRKEYKVICINFIQEGVDYKLKALHSLPFLHDLDEYTLLPLANNLTSRKYQYGEVIIAAGEKINKFRIIGSGKCKLILENKCVCCTEGSKEKSHKHKTTGRLKYGLTDYSCKDASDEVRLPFSQDKADKSQKIWKHSKKCFDQDRLEAHDGKMVYLEHVKFGGLAKGGSFGGRGILIEEDFDDNEVDHRKLMILSEPSKVSVVADSACVEVFELGRESLECLSDFLGKVIINGLKSMAEFDSFDIGEKMTQATQWTKFKGKELNGLAY